MDISLTFPVDNIEEDEFQGDISPLLFDPDQSEYDEYSTLNEWKCVRIVWSNSNWMSIEWPPSLFILHSTPVLMAD